MEKRSRVLGTIHKLLNFCVVNKVKMKVLLLSPYADKLIPALHKHGDSFHIELGPISSEYCINGGFDFIVSFGYRHILSSDLLKRFPQKAINLHISMLPRCRGSHPNFWTIVERCISGVTIHLLDEGLDTGNILYQQEILIDMDIETFRSSYRALSQCVESLFISNWESIRIGKSSGFAQQGIITSHRSAELNKWLCYLPQSWDTPISVFRQLTESID